MAPDRVLWARENRAAMIRVVGSHGDGSTHIENREEGFCGTCESRVLEGVPDHRDTVLGRAERESNTTMMICVSRCRSGRLVLDL